MSIWDALVIPGILGGYALLCLWLMLFVDGPLRQDDDGSAPNE